jgi:hypothetical protein
LIRFAQPVGGLRSHPDLFFLSAVGQQNKTEVELAVDDALSFPEFSASAGSGSWRVAMVMLLISPTTLRQRIVETH